MTDTNATHEAVRQRYARAAINVLQPREEAEGSCCGGPGCCGQRAASQTGCDPITGNLYSNLELATLPTEAALASLGCGNPTALAQLHHGEVVLDLGSGGGIDVLLSAKRVGPSGKVYGLDMTDEMLTLARSNATKVGATNVEFLKGHIEDVPLPSESVDVIISNCVINLSPDKGRVLREAFRVLKPGGRLAISDVVVDGAVPEALRRHIELWVGCVAGALDLQTYHNYLLAAGFGEISIEPTRFYDAEELDEPALTALLQTQPPEERARLRKAFMSAFVRAVKPA